MTTDKQYRKRNREGVAIIIVIGLIAVLMISAVAFSISMRIERQGSFHYRYAVQARHMLWTALSTALRDLDQNMGITNSIYPTWPVFASSNSGGFAANVMTPSITNFLSPELIQFVRAAKPGWQNLANAGRYAYVVINQSGLLDANVAGGAPRGGGLSAAELQLDALPEFGSVAAANAFLAGRTNHIRYENVMELGVIANGLALRPPPDLVTFSLSRNDQRLSGGTVTDKIYLGGDYSGFSARAAQIKQGLVDSGIAAADVDFVFNNLIDYLDADCIPHDLAAPYTEAVPMINEFNVRYRAGYAGGIGTFRCQLNHVELWYPFLRSSSNNFDVEIAFSASMYTNGSLCATNEITWSSSSLASGIYGPGAANNGEFTDVIPVPSMMITLSSPLANNANATIMFGTKAKVMHKRTGNPVVDKVPAEDGKYIFIAGAGTPPAVSWSVAGGDLPDTRKGVECIDPRFNWGTGVPYWYVYDGAGTIGSINTGTAKWLSTVAGVDEGTKMHVSDEGSLISIGELGNLLMSVLPSSKFKTIRLFDRNPANYKRNSVFEHFTLSSPAYERGRVNVNTTNRDVLASVLLDCPIGYASTNSDRCSSNRLLGASVDNVAAIIRNKGGLAAYSDVGEIGSVNNGTASWTQALPGMSDCERESILSYSAGLFTVRQNLFTIIVAADTFLTGSLRLQGTALSSARAIVEVWRDPAKDANGRHKILVRDFWLMN